MVAIDKVPAEFVVLIRALLGDQASEFSDPPSAATDLAPAQPSPYQMARDTRASTRPFPPVASAAR
jgi:hypothetical protein